MNKSRQSSSSRLSRRSERRSPRKRFFSSQRLLALIFLVLLITISLPLFKTLIQNRAIDKEIATLQAQNEAYRSRGAELKELVDYLQSDDSLEERARLNKGLKKPNETVVVVNLPNDSQSPLQEVEVADSRTANWNRWLLYFFH